VSAVGPDGDRAGKPIILTPPLHLSKVTHTAILACELPAHKSTRIPGSLRPALHRPARRHTIIALPRTIHMRPRLILPAVAALLTIGTSSARAVTCYVVFDRYDNVAYRNTVSPIDMSEQGAAARAALRQRGEYLMVMESDRCVPVTFVFGAAGSKALSIDDVVGGFPAENAASAQSNAKRPRSTAPPPSVSPAPGSSK
jgi:hypothetical protein